MNAHVSSGEFRALISTVKVLGKLAYVCTGEAKIVEGG
jgi:hypothetical protein